MLFTISNESFIFDLFYAIDVPEVERGLVLKPVPRKELTHTVVKFSGDTNAATAQPPAKKQKRSVGGSASSSVSSSSGRGGVSISSAESMYARSAGLRESAYAQPPIVAVPTSSLLPINLAQPITSSVSTSVPVPVSNEPIIDLKTVYPKMKSIVAYFWDLELPDRFVNGAFFGRIMANNYKDFGMEIFRPDFTNLLFIKVILYDNLFLHQFDINF